MLKKKKNFGNTAVFQSCFSFSILLTFLGVKMGGSFLGGKLFFEMLGLTFSSKLDRGSYIISIAKSASKKIGALIRFIKFLCSVSHKSTIRPCMEYSCHVWPVACSCYFALLDKLQKWILGLLVLHLLPLVNPWLIVEM